MNKILKFASEYAKGIIAVGGALVVTGTALLDGVVSDTEMGLVATAWATAVGVIAKRNAQPDNEFTLTLDPDQE